MLLRTGLLVSFVVVIGCEKPVDTDALMKELKVANERTCACKDVACVHTSTNEFDRLFVRVHDVKNKSEDLNSKFAALRVEQNKCAVSAMKAMGHH